jgi:hypothetical protein
MSRLIAWFLCGAAWPVAWLVILAGTVLERIRGRGKGN